MKIFSIKNLRVGLATNSSSTHKVIYKNANQTCVDFNIGHNVERFTDNIDAVEMFANLNLINLNYDNY